jgi:hypothetical protein
MKKLLFLFLACSMLVSCRKDQPSASVPKTSLCETDLCKQYYSVWKKIFMERNKMSEDYFNAHIYPYRSSINTWMSGESFSISYNVKIEWMTCKRSDQFIVKTASTETVYPTLKIRRGEYLDETEIKAAIDFFAFSSEMNVIGSWEKLAFKTQKDAVLAIQKKAGGGFFKFTEYSFPRSGVYSVGNGHPYLTAIATIDYDANKCLVGSADLATGDIEVHETECWVQ